MISSTAGFSWRGGTPASRSMSVSVRLQSAFISHSIARASSSTTETALR
jgi:hypothetical protein